MTSSIVNQGYLYKKGSGILRGGLVGRTNWKNRFFVLHFTDQTRRAARLGYYDSAPKDSFGGRVLASVPPNSLGEIHIGPQSEVRTVVNPSHKDKFCFEITVNEASEGPDDKAFSMSLAELEDKFTEEVSPNEPLLETSPQTAPSHLPPPPPLLSPPTPRS